MKVINTTTYLHNSSDCRRRSTSVSIFFRIYSSLWFIISKHWFNVAKIVWDVARNVTDSPWYQRNFVISLQFIFYKFISTGIFCLPSNLLNSSHSAVLIDPFSFYSQKHRNNCGENTKKNLLHFSNIQFLSRRFFFQNKKNTYRCSVLICPDKISLNVSISLIFSLRPPLPEFWLLNKIEFDCNEIVLPWRINAVISMPTGTLYDCNTSTQWVLSSGVSARKYHTQLFTDTSKRHSSNSWLCFCFVWEREN